MQSPPQDPSLAPLALTQALWAAQQKAWSPLHPGEHCFRWQWEL